MKRNLFLLVFVVSVSMSFAQTIHYGRNEKAGKYYSINGIKMYCEIYGSGTPLLMIHGNGGDISSFSRNIPFFAKKYQVIVADSRAQGKSTDNGDTLSFEMMADDYASLLSELNISSAHVLGWSDGGINALLLAIRHPGKVRSVASTGANLWPDSTAMVTKVWLEERAIFKKYQAQKNLTPVERNQRKLFMLDWYQPNIALASLKKIKCPVLVIAGDRDVIKTAHTTLISENIPDATLWIVPNSGHGTLHEHAVEFNKRVDDFFSGSKNVK